MDEQDMLSLMAMVETSFGEIAADFGRAERKQRLVSMLHALDDFVSAQDSSPFQGSIREIRLSSNAPEFMIIENESKSENGPVSNRSDLSPIRLAIRLLIHLFGDAEGGERQ